MGFLNDLFSNSKYLNSKEKPSRPQTSSAHKASPATASKASPVTAHKASPAAAPKARPVAAPKASTATTPKTYIAEAPKLERPVINAAPAEPVKPVEVPVLSRPETGNDPDYPVPFGYKCNWLCVKANSPLEVIDKLDLKNPEPSNWDKGIEMAYNGYRFVSPVLNGYVLVVNFGMDILTLAPELLDEKAKLFPELQFFVTQRVSDYHAWARYINGVLMRGYGWSGCDGVVFLNEGEFTPEEVRLGFINLLPSEDADWSKYKTPDEDYVLRLAAAWGIDPAFSNKNYQKSMGYICR